MKYYRANDDSQNWIYQGMKWMHFESHDRWIASINTLAKRNQFDLRVNTNDNGDITMVVIEDSYGNFRWVTAPFNSEQADARYLYSHIKPFAEIQTLY